MPLDQIALTIGALLVAVIAAALAGSLLGRRFRTWRDGREAHREPRAAGIATPPDRDGSTAASPGYMPGARPRGDPSIAAAPIADAPATADVPGVAAATPPLAPALERSPTPPTATAIPIADVRAGVPFTLADPLERTARPRPEGNVGSGSGGELSRRLGGVPPPVATRRPSGLSPAMQDRAGVPMVGEAGMTAKPNDDGRVAWEPAAWTRATVAAPMASGRGPATAAGQAAGTAGAASPRPPRRDRDPRRRILVIATIAGVVLAGGAAAAGSLGDRPAGGVLPEVGTPDGDPGSDLPSSSGGPGGSLSPDASPRPVGSLEVTQGPGGAGTPGTPRATPDPGRTLEPGATPRPGGTPRPTDPGHPVPTVTPGPTPQPTATPPPTQPPTPAPTPAPTPTRTPAPTPAPTPTPTSAAKPPAVDFTCTPSGLDVSCANRTKNAVSWTWSFGDGGTSTARNPNHTYPAAGTYTVTLSATSSEGVSASRSRTVTVGP